VIGTRLRCQGRGVGRPVMVYRALPLLRNKLPTASFFFLVRPLSPVRSLTAAVARPGSGSRDRHRRSLSGAGPPLRAGFPLLPVFAPSSVDEEHSVSLHLGTAGTTGGQASISADGTGLRPLHENVELLWSGGRCPRFLAQAWCLWSKLGWGTFEDSKK
jgi:hypothetical protein